MTEPTLFSDYDREIDDALKQADWPRLRNLFIKSGFPLPPEDNQEPISEEGLANIFSGTSANMAELLMFATVERLLRERNASKLRDSLLEFGSKISPTNNP